jgi:formiminotetrahydrofolate cyclodeaminase
MEESIAAGTLSEFCEKVGGAEPVPAGVSISAVSASLALALLAKVLDITGRRKGFSGDRERLEILIAESRAESGRLMTLADEDVRAFHAYLECLRGGEAEAIDEAMRKCIEVPMSAARAAVRGLDTCAEAVGLIHGLTAADLGISAQMLFGGVRAMLISVDFNARAMNASAISNAIISERRELEFRASHRAEAITGSLATL